MAARSFNLGNFGGQLSAEELDKAYSLAGGAPGEFSTPEPPPPVPTDMSVQRASGAPTRAINTYQNQNLADANRRIALAGQAGDAQGLDRRTHEERAQLQGRQASQAKANTDQAKADVSARKEHERKYQAEADNLYEEMKAHRTPPSESTMSKVLGIIAAAGSIGGRGGLAQGASMLSGLLGKNQDRWASEQAANSDLYKNALGMVSKDREGAEHDLTVAQRITALEANEFDSALEQAKSMGLGRNAERMANDLQLRLREDTRNGLIKMEQAKAAAATKAGLNARDKYFWDIPLDQLRQMPSQVLGKNGQEILSKRTKDDQAYRAGEADIKKKQGETGEGPGQEVLPGLVASVPLEKRDVSDIRKNRAVLTDIQGDIQRLSEIRARNKGKVINDRTDVADANQIIDGLSGKMSQLSGRGAPSESERQSIIANLLNPTDTYLTTEPMKVYSALSDRLETNFRNSIEAIGIRNLDGTPLTSKTFQRGTRGVAGGGPASGPVQRAPAPVNPNAPVGMVNMRTGQRFDVHPSRVPGLQGQGWKTVSELDPIAARDRAEAEAAAARSTPAPIVQGPAYAEMSDEEYQRQALQDAGY